MGTKENGNTSKQIQILEDGRVPAKEAKMLEDGRKEEQGLGRSTEGCQTNLRWKD